MFVTRPGAFESGAGRDVEKSAIDAKSVVVGGWRSRNLGFAEAFLCSIAFTNYSLCILFLPKHILWTRLQITYRFTMERPAKKAKLELLSDSDESDNDTQQGVKLPVSSSGKSANEGFKINSEYAKRFEHNKKREDLHRLEEKFGKANGNKRGRPEDDDDDDESSTDEEEDDDANLVTEDLDDEWMQTLAAIKSKDPRVYNKDIKFYKDFDPNAPAQNGGEKGKEKPMTLQDYHRQNLMSGYTGGEEDADAPPQTYDQEQDALRREMVGQMHAMANGDIKEEASEDDDDFKPKAKGMHESMPAAQTQQRKKAKAKKRITDTDIASADKDPETYLSNFMAAQAWRPNDSQGSRPHAFDSDDSDDDARADAFEEAYNLRFEDPALANERLQTFARDTAKYSVRRDEATGRKKAREREKEKKEAEKREREEDRARLRRLKIEAAEEKVKKIREAAGLRGKDVDLDQWRDIIEGDFDDADWDKEMTRRFGEQYYAAPEGADSDEEMADAGAGGKKRKPKKPKWDDDIDIKDLVPEFEEEETARKYTLSDDDAEDEEDGGAPIEPASDSEANETSAKKKKVTKKDREKAKAEAKRTARKDRAAIESMIDSSIPLSAATNAPASGFRYRETSPTSYGLSARDILFADDSALNNFVGLKKMAAWRDEDKKMRDRKKFSKKGRLRQWRKENFGKADEPSGGFEVVLGGGGEVGDGGDGVAEEGNVKEGARKRKRSKGKKEKSSD